MMSSNFFIIFICMFLLALHLSWGYKPVIEAFPSNIVRKRDSVTIRCSSQYQGILRLNIKRDSSFVDAKTEEQEYNFFVPNVEKDTDCTCIQVYNNIWSDYSDVLTLKVIDPKKPKISAAHVQDDIEDTKVLITCSAPDPPEQCRVKRFFLYSGKVEIRDLSANGSSRQVTFECSNLTAKYRCSYVLEVKEKSHHLITSPLSNTVTPTKHKDEEEKGSSDYDFLIPIVATVCVILILILAVILGIYFKRKNKPSPQKMKNSEYPQGEHAKANTEATYSTIDETKLRPPPDVEENIEDTTVDDDNDGITYARLNSANLKPKNTQSYTPADTGLYAEVKKSKPM
ncbi:uncharacterized protein LOC130293846 isoform X1 [Hyla sarda]|uniref:uncharacterized protein LOC130293846 isoform X1 n=1 Tax=Hyla sarda TaxID=327740 RepID=UPI0024C33095|nr:uncharacterized protein LOC130293846 isoform X1 [Hyla sarda]